MRCHIQQKLKRILAFLKDRGEKWLITRGVNKSYYADARFGKKRASILCQEVMPPSKGASINYPDKQGGGIVHQMSTIPDKIMQQKC